MDLINQPRVKTGIESCILHTHFQRGIVGFFLIINSSHLIIISVTFHTQG